MEVHAHSHTPDPSTGSGHRARKKWTHYFWEFLMLFLAVFCGFLAEYQLEHKIEKNREKQYVISLIEDLRADSLMLHGALVKNLPSGIAKADTLINLLLSNDPGQFANEIYFLSQAVRRRFFHSFQDRTIVQLRNAGGLRLITSGKIKDSISMYYRRVDVLGKFDDAIARNNDEMQKLIPQIFSVKDLKKIYIPANDSLIRSSEKLSLRSSDADLMNEFAYYNFNYRSMEAQYFRRANALYLRIPNIILSIKKEYHLH